MVEYIKKTFRRYPAVSLVALALLFFLIPQTTAALSPPYEGYECEIDARYLVQRVVMILGVLSLGYHLVKRGEVWLFLKPTKTKIAITVTVGTIISILFPMTISLFSQPDGGYFAYVVRTWRVEYLIEIYLLACFIGYTGYRRKTVRGIN